MNKISSSTITAIRQGKQEGQSLRELAEQYHIAKTTVSYYCRDLFSHPKRQYQTEIDARKRGIERAKKFTCRLCGSPTKSENRLCAKCFQRSRSHSSNPRQHHKLYPCGMCKNNFVRKPNGLCLSCYNKDRIKKLTNQEVITRTVAKDTDKATNQAKRLAYLAKKDTRAIELSKCSDSPIGAHFWYINSENIGTCKYCLQQKDMTTNKFIINPTNPLKNPSSISSPSLTLRQRYLEAMCRITCALVDKGFPEMSVILACNGFIDNFDKLYTEKQINSLEREASEYPPIPEYLRKSLTPY